MVVFLVVEGPDFPDVENEEKTDLRRNWRRLSTVAEVEPAHIIARGGLLAWLLRCPP